MKKQIHYGIVTFLYIVLLSYIGVIIYTHSTEIVQSIYLLLGLVISFTIRNIVLDPLESTKTSSAIRVYAKACTVLLEVVIITVLYLQASDLLFIFMLLILLVDFILYMPKYRAILAVLALYSYSIALLFMKSNDFELRVIVTYCLVFTLLFLVLSIITIMTRYMIGQNEVIDRSYRHLTIKNVELEKMYQSLKKAYEELEEVTILKERHRVARELHDTIGHTITKALVSVEATQVLWEKDPTLALERLNKIEESLRDGLGDIRKVLHLLEQQVLEVDLLHELNKVISSIKEQTGVEIESMCSQLPSMEQWQKKHIIRFLQEGITNGLKHGAATAFYFRLLIENGILHFLLSDNGVGAAEYIKGFGLLNMEERVRELKGSIVVETAPKEGFTIDIRFPIGEGNRH